jgi:hypothetical protein
VLDADWVFAGAQPSRSAPRSAKEKTMDIDSLSKGIGLVYTTITTLKKLKDLIPSGDKKHDVEHKLEEAEKNLKIAEAEIAKGFNYQLC